MARELSRAQCILLAVDLASESNIKALHTLVPLRPDALEPELVLQILLTYLPETVQPSLYTTFVEELVSHLWLEQQDDIQLDVSSVQKIPDSTAQKRVKKLHLLSLVPPAFPPDAPSDILTRFICHRAHRIDTETGLLNLLPELVTPLLERSAYLRRWFVSIVLPLLRLSYEYYGDTERTMTLEGFGKLDSKQAVEVLLGRATEVNHEATSSHQSEGTIGRDLKGLVGPWMYGHTERKRRRLDGDNSLRPLASGDRRISLTGTSYEDRTDHDWEVLYRWLVHRAEHDIGLVSSAIETWDGPGDVDLGGFVRPQEYLNEETQAKLERRYAQVAFASCFAVEADTTECLEGAHGILVRLAELLDFEPPPELASSVEQLPKIDRHARLLHETDSTIYLEADVLMEPEHPLTSPTLETYQLLQMLVYSAYQLAGLGYKCSIVKVAKLRFYSSADEQLAVVQKILHGLAGKGKRDEHAWTMDRDRLLWLWNWAIDPEEGALRGAGIFGSIERDVIKAEIVKALLTTGRYDLVDRLYVKDESGRTRLSSDDLERITLAEVMQCYDNASNGNRNRGSMKKAFDIVNTFGSSFPDSQAFAKTRSLIAATHSLSFYSLTLQHGVPFQPVNIRVSQDPLGLLAKVLEQNAKSYTKLDDLIGISRNLASAGLVKTQNADEHRSEEETMSKTEIAASIRLAERRVIFMCIEAALSEEDFDTAYSYLISRLAPSRDPASKSSDEDDISWRAAYLAGRYRPRSSTKPSVRTLEQRLELLSLSLLLAPPSALSEILNVWRRCEEELDSLLLSQTTEEESFDDRADRRNDIPGGFRDERTEGMVFGQKTREMGRYAARGPGNGTGAGEGSDEAPMGLFDVARGAAKAFSRNAFPLRAGAGAGAGGEMARSRPGAGYSNNSAAVLQDAQQSEGGGLPFGSQGRTFSAGSGEYAGGDQRVRRRDMVANAVTGGLASGLGWMLGATPVDRQEEHP